MIREVIDKPMAYIKSRNFNREHEFRFAVIIIRRLGLNEYEDSSECSVKLPIRTFWEPSDNILVGTFRPMPIYSPRNILRTL